MIHQPNNNRRRPAPMSSLPWPEAVPMTTHFSVEAKMGLKPVLRCPCGARIPFSLAHGPNHQVNRQVRQFVEQHAECKAPVDGGGNTDASNDAEITQAH